MITEMTAIIPRLSAKLCPRTEPERGSLKRVEASPVPNGICPILSLPPEVRAYIFQYLLDDADLCFRFSPSLETSSCWVRWPDFKKNLNFLKSCALFETEALSLVRIREATIEVGPTINANTIKQGPSNFKTPRLNGSQPIPVPISFNKIQHHIRQLNIDTEQTLSMLLEKDFFATFPRLSKLRIRQNLLHRGSTTGWREKIDNAFVRPVYVSNSLGEISTVINETEIPIRLGKLLQHERLKPLYPVTVEVTMQAAPPGWTLSDNEVPVYPIIRDVSALRFTYTYPHRRITNMEVDMYNQPMEMAIKSRWTETVSLDNERKNVGGGSAKNRGKTS